MSQSHKIIAAQIDAAHVEHSASVSQGSNHKINMDTVRSSTKDAGRVHIGGGMMRFDTTNDAGRVHVGGGMMRF
jgi:hypothetical protein